MDPDDLGARMPWAVFKKWRDYYDLQPWGQWRDGFNSATIAAILANVNRAKNQDPFEAVDFMYMDHVSRREIEERRREMANQSFLDELAARAKPKGADHDKQRSEAGGSGPAQ